MSQSPREKAARALCRLDGNPENIPFEGRPMWQSYLGQVNAVLKAALTVEDWQRISSQDDFN